MRVSSNIPAKRRRDDGKNFERRKHPKTDNDAGSHVQSMDCFDYESSLTSLDELDEEIIAASLQAPGPGRTVLYGSTVTDRNSRVSQSVGRRQCQTCIHCP